MGVENPTFVDLMRTTFFNIDAVAINLHDRKIYEGGFYQVMQTGILEINYEPNPFPVSCVMRSLAALKRFDLKPGPGLLEYIRREGSTLKPSRLVKMQELQYNRVYIPADELAETWQIGSALDEKDKA
jgi:hypothetical protein